MATDTKTKGTKKRIKIKDLSQAGRKISKKKEQEVKGRGFHDQQKGKIFNY